MVPSHKKWGLLLLVVMAKGQEKPRYLESESSVYMKKREWRHLAAGPADVREVVRNLEVNASVPDQAMVVCREACKMPRCKYETADEWIGVVPYLRGNRHLMAAWAATVWKPEDLIPLILERWERSLVVPQKVGPPRIFPGLLQGAMSRAMLDFVHENGFDPEMIFDFIFHKVLGNLLGKTPPPRITPTVLYAIGYATTFVAQKFNTTTTQRPTGWSLSCLPGLPFDIDLATARLAESICAEMPSRPYAYLCARGLYHSVKIPCTDDDDEIVPSNDVKVLADFGTLDFFKLCEDVTYKAECLIARILLALDDLGIQKQLNKISQIFYGDMAPQPGIVDSFCPVDRWGSNTTSCYYAIGAAFARHNLWTDVPTKTDNCAMPRNFDLCEPELSDYDKVSSLHTAACVEGILHYPASSDRMLEHCTPDFLATTCQKACATLESHPNANMRSAFSICTSNYLCKSSTDDIYDMDAYFNATLIMDNFPPPPPPPLAVAATPEDAAVTTTA